MNNNQSDCRCSHGGYHDDIIARLRETEGGYTVRRLLQEAADEIERLRAERDEVRQSYCSLMEAYRGGDGRVTANKLGWGYLFPRRPKKEDGK